MRNIKLIIDSFERNLKIFLFQSEVREDRDITVLILEECLERLSERKALAAVAKDYEEYFMIVSAASKAERVLEKHIDSLGNDPDFVLIYRNVVRLLPRKQWSTENPFDFQHRYLQHE